MLVIFGLLTLQVLVPRQYDHVSCSVHMEWGFKENCVAVIALHKCGKPDSQIFKLLTPSKISRNFVYWAIKHYKELWGVEDRARSGHLKSVRAEAAIKTVWERIRQNHHVLRAEHIDPIKLCLIRDDLHVRAHFQSKGHFLTPALKEIRQTRAKRLLQWHTENRHKNILFMGEKFFTIEEQYNRNKIYAQTSLEAHSEGAGMPSPFLHHGLVGGVPSVGDTSLFLQERGEAGVRMYREDVLQEAVK